MNKVVVNLQNCYGITSLSATFDFTKKSALAIYAPNGVMKSSFAQTFHDLSRSAASRDRIFEDRVCTRDVRDEEGNEIPPAKVLVVRPYDQDFAHSEKTSILLVNADLRKEYEQIQTGIEKQKEVLLNALKTRSKSKRNLEAEISSTFTSDEHEFEAALTRIQAELTEMHDATFAGVPYDTVFDDKVLALLKTPEAQAMIEVYVKRYNELLASSTYFRKGTFDYYNAGQIAKSLASNGFFAANHTISLNADKRLEIKTQKELEDVISKEKQAILKDKELRKKFDAFAKLLDANIQLREFRDFLLSHEAYVSQLGNVAKFREDVLKSYLKMCFELYSELMTAYAAAKERKRAIEAEAARQRTQWETVIGRFNRRFVVPFTLEARNRTAVMLGDETTITLGFTYDDGVGKKDVPKKSLLESLSTGEKKALYVLNVMFEVETRIKENQETLIVVDDIADSFDYQNKYAIIEYLKDISQTPLFKVIIMTHNFDFFRTVQSRFVNYDQCFMATKSRDGITLAKASGIKNIFIKDLKGEFFKDAKKKVASIPFMRNLVEYTSGDQDPKYLTLTSMLHCRVNSSTLTEADLDQLYNEIFSTNERVGGGKLIADLVHEQAMECLTAPRGANFEHKIVLAIATRLAAEMFMLKRINDPTWAASIKDHQTQRLVTKFRDLFPGDTALEILDRVVLMTPENIHLNSFMYEPIVDMSDERLRDLYQEVRGLSGGDMVLAAGVGDPGAA